jgi:para-nitrobenzyl esterase
VNNRDIVFVSIQYRLGIFGFTDFRMLNETDNRYESNCGLSDQIEALKWIQNNIKTFGGDPNQITLMGESAGASSILALMVSPLAKGLFQQAILQSPVVNIVKSKENADFWAKRALHHLKVDSENCDQLQAISTNEALMVSEKMMLEFTELTPTIFPFGPVIDDIMPYSIEDAFSKGLQMQIPLIIGTNQDEVSTFIRRPDPWFPATEQQLKTLFLQNPKWNKTNLRSMYKELTEFPVLSQFGRDLLFAVDNYNIAYHHSKNNHVYRYQFDFVTSVAQRLNLGAFHGSELPFVFHNLDSELRKIIIPDLERAKKIADYVHFAWISFINHDFSEFETSKLWEKFTPEHPNTLRINVINQLEEGTDQKIWEIWSKNR